MTLASFLWAIRDEMLHFAIGGYTLIGLDELAIDLLWLNLLFNPVARRTRTLPRYVEDLPEAENPGRVAIFVPAWKEQAVIADMLRHALHSWGQAAYRIYVGCYQNDLGTMCRVIDLSDARVRLVYHHANGPTTKADCLNAIYQAMQQDEARHGRFKAILLHDSEDLVHQAELTIAHSVSETYAMVQLPVLPLRTRGSPWISGHYLDEFAQGHFRDLTVRHMLGAGIPSAGVATILSRDVMDQLAHEPSAQPFGAGSLTEDYELGLRIAALGGRTAFLRIRCKATGQIVASRAHFPASLMTATRQKTRWTIGIAFAGWDRLGWTHSPRENWMRLRDRRALFTMLFLTTGYMALLLTGGLAMLGQEATTLSPLETGLLTLTTASLVWRLTIRALCVSRHYGWREGLVAIPRAVTANLILILSTQRAVQQYYRFLRSGNLVWDKTAHKSPLEP